MTGFSGGKIIALSLIVISGLMVFVISGWNARQAEILLRWAAEREGKATFARMVHENGMSPGQLYQNPELLKQLVAQDEQIFSAGLMKGDEIIASFSRVAFNKAFSELNSPAFGATILDAHLTLYRKSAGPGQGAGPGNGGRRPGGGQGPHWLRNQPNDDSEKWARVSFYLVFAGPDRMLVAPLVFQKYLWPVVWLLLSLFWGIIVLNQHRMADLQQKLQKESHLAVIGEMSARLAHEIKNPLGAIRGMAQLLDRKLSATPSLQNMTQTIEKETFRLEEMTRSILDYSRTREMRITDVNLNEAISASMDFLCLQNPEVKINLLLPDHSVICRGDENAIRQILINLVKNAAEAENEDLQIKIEVKKEFDFTVVGVSNRGQLSDEVKSHLFQPFFSTKTRGYGLGLSISRKLARQMFGELDLRNLDGNFVVAELKIPGKGINEQSA